MKREHAPLIGPLSEADAAAPAGAPVEEPTAAAQPAPGRAAEPHRGRLFRKYLLLVLSLVTAALLASSGIGLYFSYQEHRSALASLQNEKAIAAAARIEQYMRQVSQSVVFASMPQLDSADREARRLEFLKVLKQVPEVTDIAQLDETGREQIAVSRLGMDLVASQRDRSDEAAFREARRGQPWFGPVYFRKETEPYMTIAARSGGERGPVTIAEVNLKFIWDVVSRIKVGSGGKAYVVDAGGFLVADPDIGLVLRKTNLAHLEHVKSAPTIRSLPDPAMASRDAAGTRVLVSAATIDPPGWHVFVEQPVAEVYAKLDASIARTALLLLGGLAVSALAALALARGMVRPIRLLDEGARRIGEGQLDQQIVVRTGDEIEGLADQFNRMSAQLRESYAGLERKVEQRTAELSESLQYQTAISHVLRVISESPTDVQPVFEAIMDSAVRLLDSAMAGMFRYDGHLVQLIATRNWPAEALRRWPAAAPPNPKLLNGRVILQRQAISVEDTLADPDYDHSIAQVGTWRHMIAVPMLKDAEAVGVLVVGWPDPGKTPPRQLKLLQTFADQAVIAIENVRLLNETNVALERQTATSEVLRAISGSPTDVQPVLKVVAERAAQLCDAANAQIFIAEGGMLHSRASHAVASPLLDLRGDPLPIARESMTGRAVLDRTTVHCADVVPLLESEFPAAIPNQRRLNFRAILAVPLVREGGAYGAIFLHRHEPRPFQLEQIALVETFAHQAAIAIENVRLFNETREALEQQTATAQILQVISSSVEDSRPVFGEILRSCHRLFGSDQAGLLLIGDDRRVHVGASTEGASFEQFFPIAFDEGSATALACAERRVLHYPDVLQQPDVPATLRRNCEHMGVHSIMFAPMLWQERGVGAIFVARKQAAAFSDKEQALLKTFADQAVIAIQNARLFNETKEALERQTAIAEVLRVISGSPADVQPVLDSVAERARLLCRADGSRIWLASGGELHAMTDYGAHDVEGARRDAAAGPRVDRRPRVRRAALRPCRGCRRADRTASTRTPAARRRATASAPCSRCRCCARARRSASSRCCAREVRAFAARRDRAAADLRRPGGDRDRERAAVQRDQGSARAADRDRRDPARSSASSPTDVQPVFDIDRPAAPCGCARPSTAGCSRRRRVDRARRATGLDPDGLQALHERVPDAADRDTVGRTAIRERRSDQRGGRCSPTPQYALRDTRERAGYRAAARRADAARRRGHRRRSRSRAPAGRASPTSRSALLETFADQAVIAIENVRLFNETKEALEQQTAISEILRVISELADRREPVLDAIAAQLAALVRRGFGGDLPRRRRQHAAPRRDPGGDVGAVGLDRIACRSTGESTSGRAILDRKTVQVADMQAEAAEYPLGAELAQRFGHRTIVVAPLFREGRPFGTVLLRRQEVRPFSEREWRCCGPSPTRRRSRSRTRGCSTRRRRRSSSRRLPPRCCR